MAYSASLLCLAHKDFLRLPPYRGIQSAWPLQLPAIDERCRADSFTESLPTRVTWGHRQCISLSNLSSSEGNDRTDRYKNGLDHFQVLRSIDISLKMSAPIPVSRKRRRIAIIGGGVSGISCLWTLRHYHDYEVHLFEAEDCLGGHAHTVPFQNNGVVANVDTGFISMNDETYRKWLDHMCIYARSLISLVCAAEFSEFLKHLGVATIPTDMSFGVSVNEGQLEWGSGSFWAFLGRWSNALRPWFWRLCFDILRFNVMCTDMVKGNGPHHSPIGGDDPITNENHLWPRLESIGSYLDRLNYSKQFATLYLIPMVAAPWCIDPTTFSRDFPANFLIEFMYGIKSNLTSSWTHML